jgi:putative ABC transport system substrate-binding protein
MIRRRELITGGSAAAWPLVARAQQAAVPVIGYLSARSSESDVAMLAAFRRGLAEMGYVEGRNVTIEYRFADGQFDRRPALAADLISRQVAVIIYAGATGSPEDAVWGPLRASNIPMVFNGSPTPDPVSSGLVTITSFSRPGGNMTGIFAMNNLIGKFMGLLHELVPDAKTIAVLVAPQGMRGSASDDARESAARLGLQVLFFTADTEREIDTAFAAMNEKRAEALVVLTSPFFVTRAKLIASLAGRYRVPAIYPRREFSEAGGLISYGYDVADGYCQLGAYAGRILKGEKAGDLPVFLPTKFDLIINLKTGKTLGLTSPETLLATADEVIQ